MVQFVPSFVFIFYILSQHHYIVSKSDFSQFFFQFLFDTLPRCSVHRRTLIEFFKWLFSRKLNTRRMSYFVVILKLIGGLKDDSG